MRTRIAVALALALVACKSKSDSDRTETKSDDRARGGPGAPGAIGGSGGTSASGSGSAAAHGAENPAIADRVIAADQGSIQRAGEGPPSIADTRPDATESVPATATPVNSDQQEIARAPNQPVESNDPSGPPGRLSVKRKEGLDPSTLTADSVVAKILAAYQPGLRRCYSAGLRADPKLRGTLSVAMTVTLDGRTANAEAHGISVDVDACVTGIVGTWRFANPKQKASGEPTPARFKVDFALLPE